MRVGGGSGIGAKHLARKDASSVGILGSGAIARTCLEALQVVRPIKRAKVFSPTPTNRKRSAAEMSAKLDIAVEPVATAREASPNSPSDLYTLARLLRLRATSGRIERRACSLIASARLKSP
jgi:ornithine cyclodeaminase/alanine dehydrogenase-like protein (mu-crystallin family)